MFKESHISVIPRWFLQNIPNDGRKSRDREWSSVRDWQTGSVRVSVPLRILEVTEHISYPDWHLTLPDPSFWVRHKGSVGFWNTWVLHRQGLWLTIYRKTYGWRKQNDNSVLCRPHVGHVGLGKPFVDSRSHEKRESDRLLLLPPLSRWVTSSFISTSDPITVLYS